MSFCFVSVDMKTEKENVIYFFLCWPIGGLYLYHRKLGNRFFS